MKNFDRYGTIVSDGIRVLEFQEKRYQSSGWINGGIYLVRRNLFSNVEERFSFENYLEKKVRHLNIIAYPSDSFFIDIGVPQDYFHARELYQADELGRV